MLLAIFRHSKQLIMDEQRSQPPHIALLADAGTGHLIAMAALAKHLFGKLNLSVTLITQPTSLSSQSQQSILNNLPNEINIVPLPQIPAKSIPEGTAPHTASLLTVAQNLPHIRRALESLASANPKTVLVVDVFGAVAFDVAREVGVQTYLFFPMTCTVLSLGFYLPELEATTKGEFKDRVEPVRAPGCVPIHGRDLPEPFREGPGSENYKGFVQFLKLYYQPKAILVNSFEELEPRSFKALNAHESLPPVYPVGPLVWPGSSSSTGGMECLKWLDEQPNGSVIYVSFGSGGTLSGQQMKELALGLEMSGQRFLWVVRRPNESEASANYFGYSNIGSRPVEFLPEGFTERTKGAGLVVPAWAPQTEVLSHRATGGFMTHCGWNSTLESIVNGVPLVAWPLFAEQRTNAVMLTEDLKVAVRVGDGESGVIGREEIAGLVRSLMEGEEGKRLRRRMREIKDAAAVALEEGGSSYKSFSEIAREWNNLGGQELEIVE